MTSLRTLHIAHGASHQGMTTAVRTQPMRELTPQECTAISGGLPHLILLGAAGAAFAIGVVADNYFNGPMADFYYRASKL